MNFGRRRDENVEINITSLIDVVLLLLIFFMVSTTFLNPEHINLSLPVASSSTDSREKPHTIDVTVDKDGHYYVDGKALTGQSGETLKQAMAASAKGGKDLPVMVHADAKSTHQSVINILDAARQLGLLHISFATEVKHDDSAP
jgi:biopolymer transport protein ExbD